MLGFVKDAKSKALDNESVVVRRAAQAYATEHFAKGDSDEEIISAIIGKIDSEHALYSLLQNDANGTIFKTDVKNGKIEELFYTKDPIAMSSEGDFISTGIRYTEFNADKASLLHAEGSVTNLDINDFKAELKSEVINSVYPIGALYTSYDSTSPATLFGGEWTQIKDTFLYCADSSGQTGGEATHTLTVDEMPSHRHWIALDGQAVNGVGSGWLTKGTGSSNDNASTNLVGGGQPHNNMPPYLTVYCWRRTA